MKYVVYILFDDLYHGIFSELYFHNWLTANLIVQPLSKTFFKICIITILMKYITQLHFDVLYHGKFSEVSLSKSLVYLILLDLQDLYLSNVHPLIEDMCYDIFLEL